MSKVLMKTIITPLIKKLGTELINNNCRPVSNLAFLSKLSERTVAIHLMNHLTENNPTDIFAICLQERS